MIMTHFACFHGVIRSCECVVIDGKCPMTYSAPIDRVAVANSARYLSGLYTVCISMRYDLRALEILESGVGSVDCLLRNDVVVSSGACVPGIRAITL